MVVRFVGPVTAVVMVTAGIVGSKLSVIDSSVNAASWFAAASMIRLVPGMYDTSGVSEPVIGADKVSVMVLEPLMRLIVVTVVDVATPDIVKSIGVMAVPYTGSVVSSCTVIAVVADCEDTVGAGIVGSKLSVIDSSVNAASWFPAASVIRLYDTRGVLEPVIGADSVSVMVLVSLVSSTAASLILCRCDVPYIGSVVSSCTVIAVVADCEDSSCVRY